MSRAPTHFVFVKKRQINQSGRWSATLVVALTTIALVLTSSASASVVPDSKIAISQTGLHVFSVNGRQFGITTAIHVLSFNGPQYSITVGLAHHEIDGGLQTTSSMCQGTPDCVAAVNGDFFDLNAAGPPGPGDEVGGIIQDCALLHSPEVSHQQVNLDGHTVSNGLNWASTLTVNASTVPITAVNQEIPLSYSNVSLPLAGTLLYTAPYALAIPTLGGRTTYVFSQGDATVSPTTINASATLTFVGSTTQAVRVSSDDVDISAPAGSSLAALQPGDTASLATTSSAGCDDIGGHPILLNQGTVVPVVSGDTYLAKPYARTVIGWTATGVTILMTVDGKDAQSGATVDQLDSVLEALGVVTAIDLDGGNSTTFFAEGRVLNRPSRGNEHPVSTGLLVIRTP
jgi:hypothetical protein